MDGGAKDVGGGEEKRRRIEQRGNISGLELVHILHTCKLICVRRLARRITWNFRIRKQPLTLFQS